MPAAGIDAASLEYRSYAEAVSRELIRLGYSESMAGSVEQTATITLERRAVEAQRRSPVSVGVGGGTGSWGGGVGVGLGIDLSGPPPARIETELGVTIRENVSGASLWEGRARFAVSAKSPLAQTQLAAPRMAQALFSGFPGTSGETISVE